MHTIYLLELFSNLTVGKSLLHITLGKNASVKGGLGGDAAHQCCGYAGDGTCYIPEEFSNHRIY